MLPYREAAPVEADPSEKLGARQSLHVAPPLRKVLLGPVLIAGALLAIALIVGASLVVAAALGAALFGLLAWAPLRVHGTVVALHARGLVVKGAVVAFEDVDEVWFEIPLLHSSQGAHLRALRLVGFDRTTHRVPLALEGSAALATAILRECSEPLYAEARKALVAGETLTFGPTQLTRSGITVEGAYAPWSEIRLARLQPARVAFLRRLPFLTWRAVRLDRIPNPSIFCALVARNVKEVQRDGSLMLELDGATEVGPAPTRGRRDRALQNLLVGSVAFSTGLGITYLSSCGNPGYGLIAIGPIVFGALRFVQGLLALTRT